jgi:hypothetical protein
MASVAPSWLSWPSDAVSPLMASSVPTVIGAPDATSTQPNSTVAQSTPPPVAAPLSPPGSGSSSLEQAAPISVSTPTSASSRRIRRCFM